MSSLRALVVVLGLRRGALLRVRAAHVAELADLSPVLHAHGEPRSAWLLPWQSSHFRRPVLGCMDSYDSEQRRILQHFLDLQDLHSFAPQYTRRCRKFLSNF